MPIYEETRDLLASRRTSSNAVTPKTSSGFHGGRVPMNRDLRAKSVTPAGGFRADSPTMKSSRRHSVMMPTLSTARASQEQAVGFGGPTDRAGGGRFMLFSLYGVKATGQSSPRKDRPSPRKAEFAYPPMKNF
jgi:hypothetical protein